MEYWNVGSKGIPSETHYSIIPRFHCPRPPCGLLAHQVEKILVRLCFAHLVDDELDGIDGIHLLQEPAQDPDAVQVLLRGEELFLARAGADQVEGREDSPVGDPAVQDCLLYTSPSPRD